MLPNHFCSFSSRLRGREEPMCPSFPSSILLSVLFAFFACVCLPPALSFTPYALTRHTSMISASSSVNTHRWVPTYAKVSLHIRDQVMPRISPSHVPKLTYRYSLMTPTLPSPNSLSETRAKARLLPSPQTMARRLTRGVRPSAMWFPAPAAQLVPAVQRRGKG